MALLAEIPWAMALGLMLGLRHATDADHVAAVATLLRREQGVRGAALVGGSWGLGHAGVLAAVGGVLSLTGLRIPERFATIAELVVCAMLVVLGVVGLVRARREQHEQHEHDESHGHEDERSPSVAKSRLSAIAVGAVHGLAGSAGVAILGATNARSLGAFGFLLFFGLGTIGGMVLTTTALSVGLGRVAERSRRGYHRLVAFACTLSVVMGVALAARILRG